jgi:hypothetical protein
MATLTLDQKEQQYSVKEIELTMQKLRDCWRRGGWINNNRSGTAAISVK